MKREGKSEHVESQLEMVRKHLLTAGSITTWEAIEQYHITRLSHYIYLLRKEGYHFDVDKKPNLHNQGYHSVYILKEEVE